MFLFLELLFCIGCHLVSLQSFAEVVCFSYEILVIFCVSVFCQKSHLMFLQSELLFCVGCHLVSL